MDEPMDDVNQLAGEEASISESSTEEPKATEDVGTEPTEPEIKTEEVGETQAETVEAPKKGAQQRIRELASEKNEYKEKAQSLEQKLAELTGSVEPTAPHAPQIPQVNAGTEVSPEQYRNHVLGTAQTMVELKIKQSDAIHRINNEAHEAIRKYPQLDPESDQFDKGLSDSVTEAVEAVVRTNPYTASPKKLVDKWMKPYQGAVTREVSKETENIAKQVSDSATRPTSITTRGGKTDADMTPAELEKKYGIIQS